MKPSKGCFWLSAGGGRAQRKQQLRPGLISTNGEDACLGIDRGKGDLCIVCVFTVNGMHLPFDPVVGPGC